MDPSKLVTSWCVVNIWGLYSIMVIFLGVIASISAIPTGAVITQASLPVSDSNQSISDSSPHPTLVNQYVKDLKRTLNMLCTDFANKRSLDERDPFLQTLNNLPNIDSLLPNIILTRSSEELPSRMWIHYRLLQLFNRSMDNIIFDENQNNASHNFGSSFRALQKKIGRVLAGVLEMAHSRSWEENTNVTITLNTDDVFGPVGVEILRNLRDYTVLSYYNQYLPTLVSDIHLL